MQYVLKSIPTNNFKTILLLLLVFLYMNFPIGWHEKKKVKESPFILPAQQFTNLGKLREGKGGKNKTLTRR